MAKLDKIKISGFKSIKNVEFDLRAINVLIGANGSGKSNFIEAFNFLRQICDGNLSNYVNKKGGGDALLHFGSKQTKELRFEVSFDQGNGYIISLQRSELDELVPVSEYGLFHGQGHPQPYREPIASNGDEAGLSRERQTRVGDYVKTAMTGWRVYHFHDTGPSSPLKKTAHIDDNKFFRTDGSNLSSFLFLLKSKFFPEYKKITNTIRMIAPFLDDFDLQPRALDSEKIRLQWKHVSSDEYFNVNSFSDGTLRFIAIAVVLLQPKALKPSIIILDEPELGLHPSAVTLLGAMVRQASEESQIIISTQSPLLLDTFDPEDVIVVNRSEEASTFERLDSKKLESWLNDYSLGELWEKNEIGGRPKGAKL